MYPKTLNQLLRYGVDRLNVVLISETSLYSFVYLVTLKNESTGHVKKYTLKCVMMSLNERGEYEEFYIPKENVPTTNDRVLKKLTNINFKKECYNLTILKGAVPAIYSCKTYDNIGPIFELLKIVKHYIESIQLSLKIESKTIAEILNKMTHLLKHSVITELNTSLRQSNKRITKLEESLEIYKKTENSLQCLKVLLENLKNRKDNVVQLGLFLMEYIPGITLYQVKIQLSSDNVYSIQYFIDILINAIVLIVKIYLKGYELNDCHQNNIIIRPDGTVTIVDVEDIDIRPDKIEKLDGHDVLITDPISYEDVYKYYDKVLESKKESIKLAKLFFRNDEMDDEEMDDEEMESMTTQLAEMTKKIDEEMESMTTQLAELKITETIIIDDILKLHILICIIASNSEQYVWIKDVMYKNKYHDFLTQLLPHIQLVVTSLGLNQSHREDRKVPEIMKPHILSGEQHEDRKVPPREYYQEEHIKYQNGEQEQPLLETPHIVNESQDGAQQHAVNQYQDDKRQQHAVEMENLEQHAVEIENLDLQTPVRKGVKRQPEAEEETRKRKKSKMSGGKYKTKKTKYKTKKQNLKHQSKRNRKQENQKSK